MVALQATTHLRFAVLYCLYSALVPALYGLPQDFNDAGCAFWMWLQGAKSMRSSCQEINGNTTSYWFLKEPWLLQVPPTCSAAFKAQLEHAYTLPPALAAAAAGSGRGAAANIAVRAGSPASTPSRHGGSARGQHTDKGSWLLYCTMGREPCSSVR